MTRTYAEGVEDAARALKAWEDWEAAVILDPSAWSDQYGFTVEGDNYDHYIELQDLRNAAIRTLSPSPSGIEDAREALTGWQAIHAAIRDEQPRLLLMRDGRIVVGFWSSWNSYWTNGQSDRMSDHVMIGNPTHFMPLPAPPLPESASSKIGGDHG